jgi:hypothetical protein
MAEERKESQFNEKYFIPTIVIIAAIIISALIQNSQPIACTEEAKLCPDGSYVGRVPPNCEFAPCPNGTCKCPENYVQEGDACNPQCYYSTPRCLMPSIQCGEIKSCESDSDCVGAECCHPTSCINKAYKGVCNLVCTAVCEGPLDCGAGSCGCVNHECIVISK